MSDLSNTPVVPGVSPRGWTPAARTRFLEHLALKGHVRAACALSDGERLYALRYSSDDQAPSLYHRWSESRQGWAVVSEPLESDEADWTEVSPGSFCTFERDRVEVVPFCPEPLSAAA